jgi:6-phosphogluconolactonase (cycloisomerase 2 family)
MLLVMAATLFLANCAGAPGCPQAAFGGTPCSPGGGGNLQGGGSGPGGGGGSNATPTAFVYAVDQTGGTSGTGANGTIDGYDLSTSAGSFRSLSGYTAPQISPDEAGEAMVVVNKQFVYAVFELQGEIAGWSINSTSGALTTLAGFPMTGLTLNLPLGVTGQYQMTTDPGGKYLFISSSGGNDIFVYAINSTTGALTAVLGSPFSTLPAGFEPGNITTDGLGRFLYVTVASTHGGTEFFGYSIGSNGALTLIAGSPFAANVWELQGDASGRYLVGTSGNSLNGTGSDDDHLYVFSINQSTGAASLVNTVATTYSPWTIAMQPASSNGEFVYSFSLNDSGTGYNGIEGYELNTSTGALTKVTGSPFSNGLILGWWGQFDQSGTNLLVYSSQTSGSGTLVRLAPLAVGASGALTQPIAAVTLTTTGWWVVTDP